MRRLSIKLKVTLYFTVIMSVLASIQLVYTTSISRTVAKNELYDTVIASVDELYNQVHYKKPTYDETNPPSGQNRPDNDKKPPNSIDEKPSSSVLDVPDDAVFQNGDVFLYICETDNDAEERKEYGALPEGIVFKASTAKTGVKTSLSNGINDYYVYAKLVRNPGNRDEYAWVVGAINAQLSSTLADNTLRLTLFAVPVIIIFAALLGYAITKRAFRPVSDITKAAAEIAGSNDLSKRINLKGNEKDELSNLANTFDGMLDTIQSNYEREKQFTDDASHELRTPVAVILAQSELAMSPNATDEDVKEAMAIINKQSLKMRKLLSELLSLARSDNNRTVLEKETFDLVELAEMVVEEERCVSQTKNISISVIAKKPIEVFADKTAIMRVLINFINNAVKYGKDGGFIEITIERHGEAGAKCIVRDNGIGISKEDLPKIWDRFYRVDPSRTDDGHSSTGLGLPMAKSIIKAHNGTVSVDSVCGEGSSFEFTI